MSEFFMPFWCMTAFQSSCCIFLSPQEHLLLQWRYCSDSN